MVVGSAWRSSPDTGAIEVGWGLVTRRCAGAIIAFWAVVLAGCTPLYTWDTDTTTARLRTLDIADLAREPVATAGVVAPGGLQGFSTTLSHALSAAIAHTSPPIRVIPAYQTMNALNDQDLSAEYADLLAGFSRSGIMERERLQRIGSALGVRYLLLPGLADLNQVILDKFELAGFKIVRTRITVLRVWLQLWDVRTGHIVWESSGHIATASNLFRSDRLVPIDTIAQRLWHRLIQEDLLEAR